MNSPVTIVWFRHDLRLDDNPALQFATDQNGPVIPVFIWNPKGEGDWPPGEASCWWYHQSLKKLQKDLQEIGSRLIIRTGDNLSELKKLVEETDARSVFWNRRYEPIMVAHDSLIKQSLRKKGVLIETFHANLLYEPWEILNQQNKPYKVFTPYWKALVSKPGPDFPEPRVTKLEAPTKWPKSISIKSLELEPKIDWADGIRKHWKPGCDGALQKLEIFLNEKLDGYSKARNLPTQSGTSLLSPHLHFGEIGPRQLWHAVRDRVEGVKDKNVQENAWAFLRQLAWRDFAHSLLFHFPYTANEPLRDEFQEFPWQTDEDKLRNWQEGQTGYPIVDAGMRQLWIAGWMHNRVRMITASFLVKDLLIHWKEGAKWFWNTLVDADLANNTMGWQWVAGCGADAAPYFRIFNPVLQGEKFDPEGEYVKKWVPELISLPAKYIHKPWEADEKTLKEAKVELGKNYPFPIVDHKQAREKALQAYDKIKKSK